MPHIVFLTKWEYSNSLVIKKKMNINQKKRTYKTTRKQNDDKTMINFVCFNTESLVTLL